MTVPEKIMFCLITFLIGGCEQGPDASYEQSILEWQQTRLANLIKEDGWATLAGLFPLREGKQTFGSGQEHPLVFPDFAPDHMGSFLVSGDSVWLEADPGGEIYADSQRVSRQLLSPAKEPVLCTDGRLQWFLIRRGDQYLVRLRDIRHPARKALTHIPYFPVDKKWRLEATFHAFDTAKILPLPNVLDMVVSNVSPGYLTFDFEGNRYSILTVEETPDELFLLFYDETSGNETYGGGRYLYVARPPDQGTTILDFNKAYSPPCAFTEFATCLLPPTENRLPLAITAGEKDPHFLDH